MDHNRNRHRLDRASGNKRVAVLVVAALMAALMGIAGVGSGAAQTNTVTFSGTVSASDGVSTDSVIVSVAAWCWGDSCVGAALPGSGSPRPQPLDPVVFLGESEVDSSGRYSVTVSGVQPQDVNSVLLVVWDPSGELGTRLIGSEDYSQLWSWESLSGIDVELNDGGRVTGRFTDIAGGPPPPGGYALLQLEWPRAQYALSVSPATGHFVSPVVAPGEYGLAHGNHREGYLANNDAARVQVTAGQTADVGKVQVQQPGQITGTVTDRTGRALSGITVSGRVSSESSYWLMPNSPFNLSGAASFSTTTGDDGTYTAQSLFPDDNWQVEFEVPVPQQFTAIDSRWCGIRTDGTISCWGANRYAPAGTYTDIAAGYYHTCAIRTDQTLACWGDHNFQFGELSAPGGRYIDIAAGWNHSCAIKTDQTIACWGDKRDGKTDAPSGTFTAIGGGSSSSHACAIKSDQTIACWGNNSAGQADAPSGTFTAIATGYHKSCGIKTDQTITCWGAVDYFDDYPVVEPSGAFTAIAVDYVDWCAIRTNGSIACWGPNGNAQTDTSVGAFTALTFGHNNFCAIRTDRTIACWVWDYDEGTMVSFEDHPQFMEYSAGYVGNSTVSGEQIAVDVGETVTCNVGWPAAVSDPEVTCSGGQTEAADEIAPEDDTGTAARCFAAHRFGAEPVDVAKAADGQTVLAQLSWGFHYSIGCYLTLDEAALRVLRAAPAPLGFPAADPDAAQRCSAAHQFGAQPVDVAKTADGQTVLAQVRWGFHESIGCYLALDTASTAALRAAHTP